MKREVSTNLGGPILITFIVLKLCGVIHWSWLWVLSPLWLQLAIILAIIAIVFAVHSLAQIIKLALMAICP